MGKSWRETVSIFEFRDCVWSSVLRRCLLTRAPALRWLVFDRCVAPTTIPRFIRLDPASSSPIGAIADRAVLCCAGTRVLQSVMQDGLTCRL